MASKIKEKVDLIKDNIKDNFNDSYRDAIFLTIRKNPELKKILQKITILLQYLTLFSWFFLILAVISIFLYTKKTALILFGLTSAIHIIFAPLALLALKKQNRYLLFSFCLANLVWLASITFAFFYFIFIAETEDETRKQFSNEIVLHVGFAFYYPIAFFTTFFFMRMFKILIEGVTKSNLIIQQNSTAQISQSESLRESHEKVNADARV